MCHKQTISSLCIIYEHHKINGLLVVINDILNIYIRVFINGNS